MWEAIDQYLFVQVNSGLAHPLGDWFFQLMRNKYTWVPMYAALLFFILRRDMRSGLFFFLFCALGILLSDQVASSVFKPFFHRLRPCQLEDPSFPVRLVLAHCGSGYSFVSAHAANHFMLSGLLFFYFRSRQIRYSGLWFGWAAAIAFSQIYVGVHYPGDVLAGAIWGLAVAVLMIFGYRFCIAHFKISP